MCGSVSRFSGRFLRWRISRFGGRFLRRNAGRLSSRLLRRSICRFSRRFLCGSVSGLIGRFLHRLIRGFGSGILRRDVAVLLVTLIISFFSIAFGEMVPKRVAMQRPLEGARLSCRVVSATAKVMRPMVAFLSLSTNAVLKLLRLKTEAGFLKGAARGALRRSGR